MQRSRKALLTRSSVWKINEKSFLYKVSFSLALFLWGLLFLLNIRTDRDDGYRDLPTGSRTMDEFKLEPQNLIVKTIHNKSHFNKRKPVHFSFTNEEEEPKEMPYSKPEKSRSVPLGLNEFKNKPFSTKTHPSNGKVGSIIHRLELSGQEYNYASSSKGAKVLDHNKEANGASNVLNSDKNMYLRNPCSSDGKFVILELSEETLVDTFEIANFEHYSSNLKGFELFGSLVYPTESWVKLGNFTSGNVKHTQRFVLQEPKWVRHVKLNLNSHYGTGFYCTLSILRVYGVDAVEMMLEDLVFARNNEISVNQEPDPELEPEPGAWLDESNVNRVAAVANMHEPPVEVRQQQVGRLPGDSVLKILMQKVRLLDINITLLERFLDELNSRYGHIFKEIDEEIGERDELVAKILMDLRGLQESKDVMIKHVEDLVSWKSLESLQLDNIIKDNAFLRLEVAKVRENQARIETKGVVIFLVSLIFGSLAIAKLFLGNVLFVSHSKGRSNETSMEFWSSDYSSGFLVLSCTIIIMIALL